MKRLLTLSLLAASFSSGLSTAAVAAASPASTPWCSTSTITLSAGPANGAAGTIYHPLIFTNKSKSACQLSGVAALQPGLAGKNFVAVGPASRNTAMGIMAILITLAPGQSASDNMGVSETGNYSASACKAKTANAVAVQLGAISETVSFGSFSVCTALASTTTRLLSRGTQG
jgi:hypothetical protein